jgi:lipopolysaccharide biosynthesis protein
MEDQLKKELERLNSLNNLLREENLRMNSEICQIKSRKKSNILSCLQPIKNKLWNVFTFGFFGVKTLLTEGPGSFLQKFTAFFNSVSDRKIRSTNIDDSDNNRYISELLDRSTNKSGEYVPLSKSPIHRVDEDIKLIAFYLPQFHPIPENDLWWGKGFTEWTNVTKAVPHYAGHYQPHLPDELGFYDLRVPEIQRRQIELAKHYGVYGFCFHYYWFGGARLLERPINQFLNDPKMDFPFCICWANESWTRRWDGSETEVLIAQKHTKESDIGFIKDVSVMFKDPRYIKIEGRPILIVYRVLSLRHPKKTVEKWRQYCRQSGIGEIYLIAAQTYHLEDPRKYGFDAAVEFPPHNMCLEKDISKRLAVLNSKFSGHILSYESYVKGKAYLKGVPYTVFKCIVPSWDNTARKHSNATILHGATPVLYKEWLLNIIGYTRKEKANNNILFINAWNEWAEGDHLEPDRKYGYAYLQATSEAIIESRPGKTDESIKKGDIKLLEDHFKTPVKS